MEPVVKVLQQESGFSLIEMLVALALLAVAFGALQTGLTGGWRGAAAADTSLEAINLAETRLAAAGVEAALREGVSEGDSGAFHWRVTTSARAGNDSKPGQAQGYWITADVEWHERLIGTARQVSLTTLKILRASEARP